MRSMIVFLVLALTIGSTALAGETGSSPQTATGDVDAASLKKQIEELKAGQRQILEELEQIRGYLARSQKTPAPTAASLDIKAAQILGNSNAKLTLLEISDYECPYCRRHFREVEPRIRAAYVDTNELRYAFVDSPLEPIHPAALKAAEAAQCAAEQGKFWEMHDALFSTDTIDDTQLAANAAAASLDLQRFNACRESGRYLESIRKGRDDLQRAGFNGTPLFVLGYVDEHTGRISVVKTLRGALPFAAFQRAIDGMLGHTETVAEKP